MNILGIDIGGTKVALGIMDENGSLKYKTRYPHRKCPGDEWLEELYEQLDAFLAEHNCMPDLIGIGARGHIDYEKQVIASATNMQLNGPLDLCTPLSQRYGCPAAIDNDAKASASLELFFGKGKTCGSFVCYNIGTGIGSCVVMDRRILRGDHNFSGEIGYDLLKADDSTGKNPESSNGRPPFLENLAAGSGLQSAYRIQIQASDTSCSRDLFALAKKGDAAAASVIDRAAQLIGTSIYNLHNLLDISHFVFAGGVSGQEGFLDSIYTCALELIEKRPGPKELYFSVSEAGSDDSGLIGAACTALYRFQSRE